MLLPFDQHKAVSSCRFFFFSTSSCSWLKVEVIPPERNTLGVLQIINPIFFLVVFLRPTLLA